ncbi:unnamed protein product [Durusdinium trenchii]|uniref:Protein arginine N-methyltransferase 6 (Histone-arginine N-methyltransferase PRMT6) n=2 Tax=Durusdinium trenchii TaxID=1381693 RepID=A0ABP0HLV5_9DINO
MTDPLEVSREDLRAVYDPEMHLMMLRDSSRHRFYARCLLEHRTELEGKVAVDLGAGIGILSALAVRFGRLKEVHAVEALPEVCRIIPRVLQRTLEEESAKVTVHCGFAEEVCDRPGWPGSGAALIVSEWLGIMALNEGMARPLLRCRDSLCRASCRPRMLPGLLRIWVQAASPPGAKAMKCGPRAIPEEYLHGNPHLLLDLDLNTCSIEDLFESPPKRFQLSGGSDGSASGLVGWFDLQCCREHEVILSTSPSAPTTHWLQCWMPFQTPLGSAQVKALHVKIQLVPQSTGLPELCVLVTGESKSDSHLARFFLDRGLASYETGTNETKPSKRRRRRRDIEAVYFPSDLQELLTLAETAVNEGARTLLGAEGEVG